MQQQPEQSFSPFRAAPLLPRPLLLRSLGLIISAGAVPKYGLHLSSSQHPRSAHWTPMRPNKLVPVRMRPSLEYHLHFTHCYHPELPHMVIQKTLCVALVCRHIFLSSSSSLSLPTARLSLSLSLSLSPSVPHSLRLSPPLSLSLSLSHTHTHTHMTTENDALFSTMTYVTK